MRSPSCTFAPILESDDALAHAIESGALAAFSVAQFVEDEHYDLWLHAQRAALSADLEAEMGGHGGLPYFNYELEGLGTSPLNVTVEAFSGEGAGRTLALEFDLPGTLGLDGPDSCPTLDPPYREISVLFAFEVAVSLDDPTAQRPTVAHAVESVIARPNKEVRTLFDVPVPPAPTQ